MRLWIQTLTGQRAEVEADLHNSILDLKKVIHKSMNIIGTVRVIKGQEVLLDGSTLEQHGITDGSTINIVIEPEKNINLRIKLGPRVVVCTVKNSVRLPDLKQKLIDDDIIGFSFDEFGLFLSADDNDGMASDVSLEDNSLPLHLFGVGDNATIKIIGGSVLIHLVGPNNERWRKVFPKTMTINQMKKTIMPLASFLQGINVKLITDFILFLKRGATYKKLQGEVPVGAVLSSEDHVYFILDMFSDGYPILSVYCRGEFVGRVASPDETVLGVKLCVQSQFGFPVSCVDVKRRDGSSAGDHEFYDMEAQIVVS